jgi:hypothetical protein
VHSQVGSFGELLAHQPVGVLVRAAHPRPPRIGEEHALAEQVGDQVVPGHLAALVPGQREQVARGCRRQPAVQGGDQSVGAMAVGQVDQTKVAGAVSTTVATADLLIGPTSRSLPSRRAGCVR